MALFEVIKNIRPAFSDERGSITNIIDKPLCHLAIITSKAGAVRANHYHPHQTQHDYLISGRFEFVAKDVRSGDSESVVIEPGDLVVTGPNIAHAMRFLEDSVFLTITDGGRDTDKYAEHTIKFQVI